MRFRPLLLSFFAFVLVCAVARPSFAQEAQYTASVPVSDTTEAQRDHAFSVALSQVLGRVAGNGLSSKPGYADALGKAANYVQQYQYKRGDGGQGFMLQVAFDAGAVRRLVGSFGASAWAGSRPPVLLLVRDASGQPVTADQLAALVQAAAAGGVSFVFPRADAQPDRAALAQGDEHALAQVARQYHTGLVLLGTLNGGGASWTLLAAGQVQSWHGAPGSRDDALAAAGGRLVDRLTKQFGVSASAGGGQGVMWVDGIDSAEDFAQLIASVRNDALVRSVQPSRAQGHGVALKVEASVPVLALASELVAGGRLLPSSDAHQGADATLRWLH